MSLESCNVIPEGCAANAELKGYKLIKTYTRPYRIIVIGADNEGQVLTYALSEIPSTHPSNVRARRKSLRVEFDKNGPRPHWKATADYSTETEKKPSPLWPETKAKISGNADYKEVAVYKDLENKPVQNSAGDPYDPPLTDEKDIPVITIQVNLARGEFSPSWLKRYFRAVNNSTFMGWPQDTVKVQDLTFAEETYTDENETEIGYYAVTIKLAFDEDGWQPKVLSQGFRQLDDDDNKVPITVNGREVTAPVALDGSGHALLGDDADGADIKQYIIKKRTDLGPIEVFLA